MVTGDSQNTRCSEPWCWTLIPCDWLVGPKTLIMAVLNPDLTPNKHPKKVYCSARKKKKHPVSNVSLILVQPLHPHMNPIFYAAGCRHLALGGSDSSARVCPKSLHEGHGGAWAPAMTFQRWWQESWVCSVRPQSVWCLVYKAITIVISPHQPNSWPSCKSKIGTGCAL